MDSAASIDRHLSLTGAGFQDMLSDIALNGVETKSTG